MRDRRFQPRRRVAVTLAGALVAVASLTVSTVASTSAGAAPIAVSGTASVAIGFSGIDLGVPQTSTFTGSIDDANGATHVTVADADLDLSFPLGDDTVGFSGTFSNPGGFSGNVSGSNAQLTGTARFKLTGVVIPGLDAPPILGFLPCTLDFVPAFTGGYDAVAGTITVSDPAITVPQFPTLCASVINAALATAGLDLDINELLAAAPPASAMLSLTLDTPLVTTSTSSSSTTASSPTTTSSTTASPTTVSPSTTASPTTLSPSTTASPTTVSPSTTASPTTVSPNTTTSPTLPPVPSTRPSTTSSAPMSTTTPQSTVGPGTSAVPTVTRPPATTSDPSGSTAPSTTADSQVRADGALTPSGTTGGSAPTATPVRATPAYTG